MTFINAIVIENQTHITCDDLVVLHRLRMRTDVDIIPSVMVQGFGKNPELLVSNIDKEYLQLIIKEGFNKDLVALGEYCIQCHITSHENEVWEDGTCRACGHLVEEKASDRHDCDYMNRCINPKCKNHEWHHVGDQDELDYYVHNR